ncbi:MAG: phosphate acyltransferase PlsX [Verrucomicrobia bacterium]|nr:MAG: phosphate acyltransferase PlsX [Verrucomicrobiota bacterium]
MKLALDAMGGDHAPSVNILGAKAALALYPAIKKIFLVGDGPTLEAQCQEHRLSSDRITIVHASEVIGMAEPGAKTVDLVKTGDADAFISAGNTGACVASATIKLRLIEGIERAGIASPLPNEHGVCNILDAGANPEAKPQHLIGYAIMGTAFAKHVLGVADPLVGLMSNGEEDEKGTTFTKETFALLKETPGIHFIGNVEGHDLFETPLHVVLCDGFTGNIVLKSCEATAKAMGKWLKQELTANPLRTLGAAMAKGAFKALKEKSSYESYGGCPLLGVNGVVIIAHGSSSALAIQNALRVAMETVENKVNDAIREALAPA